MICIFSALASLQEAGALRSLKILQIEVNFLHFVSLLVLVLASLIVEIKDLGPLITIVNLTLLDLYEFYFFPIWFDVFGLQIQFMVDVHGAAALFLRLWITTARCTRLLPVAGEARCTSVRSHLDYLFLLYTSPSPRDRTRSRMPSSA